MRERGDCRLTLPPPVVFFVPLWQVIVSFLRHVFADRFSRAVAITAPTGIAATHIGGTTIHSATGVGVPTFHADFERRMGGGGQNAKGKQLAINLEVLLIDEVSMLAAEFLDLLDVQLRKLVAKYGRGLGAAHRGEPASRLPPFGGIQIIACGDFFQLPPIVERVPMQTWSRLLAAPLKECRAVLASGLDKSERELYLNRGFAFQSAVWWRADILLVELKHVWRQKDAALVATLNRIRRGEARSADVEWLNRQCAAPALASHTPSTIAGAAQTSTPSAPRPMLLAPTNAVVSERNSRELQAMVSRAAASQWIADDWVELDESCPGEPQSTREWLLRQDKGSFYGDCLAERRVELCEGARVILLVNLDLDAQTEHKLCNGSLGVVAAMPEPAEVAAAFQARLAELDQLESQASLQLAQGNERSRDVLLGRVHYYQQYKSHLARWVRADRAAGENVGGCGGCWNRSLLVPRVNFDNGRSEILFPALLSSEVVGCGVCNRLQVPLKPAWAVTIHKSQGMTLDAAAVQVTGCFDDGMAYVSLSRVRTLSGLRFQRNCPSSLECTGCVKCVCRLGQADIRASAEVKMYYSLVERTEAAAATLRTALITHGHEDEAEAIVEEGPRSIAEASRRLAERIDLPNALKRRAHEAYVAAQALNPGEVGSACGGWAHHPPTHRVKGWWSVMPQCDSKVNRKL